MIHIGWPQGIIIAFQVLGIVLQKDGEMRAIQAVLATVYLSILYWGGFFS